MGHFNKGKNFGDRSSGRDRGGDRRFNNNRGGSRNYGGGRDGGRPQMHKVTCDECGNHCEVPFQPTNGKPIYCSDCFQTKDGNNNSRDSRGRENREYRRRDSQPRFNDKKSYQEDSHKKTENYKEQFEQLNSKLDRILKILAPYINKEFQESETQKARKAKKVEKKQVDTSAVKEILSEALTKKTSPKKKSTKKPTKKTTKKKSPAKKTTKKKISSAKSTRKKK